MFKVARAEDLPEARKILNRIYSENPSHWPNGLTPDHFDDGLYLVRQASDNTPVGFVGWQIRKEPVKESSKSGRFFQKVGYYSVGILPEYRRNRFAKKALEQLFEKKAAGVDCVRALISPTNHPSQGLAKSIGVPAIIKGASHHDSERQKLAMAFYFS